MPHIAEIYTYLSMYACAFECTRTIASSREANRKGPRAGPLQNGFQMRLMHAIDSTHQLAWYEMLHEHGLHANFPQVRGRDGARLKALVGKASGRADGGSGSLQAMRAMLV